MDGMEKERFPPKRGEPVMKTGGKRYQVDKIHRGPTKPA